VIAFLLCFGNIFSQKTLDLHYYSLFGKEKNFQFFLNSNFSYRLKGRAVYETHKLVNMQDSLLVFDNDSVVLLSQIKAVKIKGMNISPYFFSAGVLLFLSDIGYNIAYNKPHIVNERTVLVSAACIAGGIVMSCIQNKHIRIRKSTTLRIIEADYRNLSSIK
jgi:hypothetical protein